MNWFTIMENVIITIVVPLVSWGLWEVIRYFKSKTKSDRVRLILDQAYQAAEMGVSVTAQTFVDSIKGTDEWTPANMQEAAYRAYEVAIKVMGQEAYDLLDSITGSAAEWLQAAIEDAVRDDKP